MGFKISINLRFLYGFLMWLATKFHTLESYKLGKKNRNTYRTLYLPP